MHPNSSFLSFRVVAFAMVVTCYEETEALDLSPIFVHWCYYIVNSHVKNKEIAFLVFVKRMPQSLISTGLYPLGQSTQTTR